MISNLATLALASSCFMAFTPSAAKQPPLANGTVSVHINDTKCTQQGMQVQYSVNVLEEPCSGFCMDLPSGQDYTSISILDPEAQTTCYVWGDAGCNGPYIFTARVPTTNSSIFSCVTPVTPSPGDFGSVKCYRGFCQWQC
jgi:hypothetical protein